MKKIILLILMMLPLDSFAKKDLNILILHSYHPQYSWTKEITKHLLEYLETEVYPENIFIEYLDSRRFTSDNRFEVLVSNYMRYKYSERIWPDVIISVDDYALDFLTKYHKDVFPEVPIVFGGVNVIRENLRESLSKATGVYEGIEIEKNIELIKSQRPNLKELIVVSDNTVLGKLLSKEFLAHIKKENFKFRLLEKYSFEELYEVLSNSSSENAALLLGVHKDRLGRYFSYSEDLKGMSNASNIPIYAMWGIANGHGVVGGYMTDAKQHAEEIYNFVLSVTSGSNPSLIPIQSKTMFKPKFDHNLMRRFKITSTPLNSQIINVPVSFYGTHRLVINIGVSIVFILGLIIFILQYLIHRKTRELNIANERLNDFVGTVAHDVRNPIGSIIGYIDVLLEDAGENEDIMKSVKRSADKALVLVNDLLDLSAIESGLIKLNLKPIELSELLNQVVEELKPRLNQKEIQVISQIDATIKVNADAKRLDQIFQNIITNAIKFTKENGKIELKAEVVNGRVLISIKDNGVGMSEEIKNGLFDKNIKVSRPGTKGERGTGYGLPLVYQLVKCHNSELNVESKENEGSRFYFYLDLAQ